MASNVGKFFTRDAIIERVFGIDFQGSDRIIDVHIKNISKKIEEDSRTPKYILTVTKAKGALIMLPFSALTFLIISMI